MRLSIVTAVLRSLALIKPNLKVPMAQRSGAMSRALRAGAILDFTSTRTAAKALGIVFLICVSTFLSRPANAWHIDSEAQLRVCNAGEMEVSVTVGEVARKALWGLVQTSGKAIGYFTVDRNDCTEISIMHDRSFNLAFEAALDNGNTGYIVLDATKGVGSGKEITYQQWRKSERPIRELGWTGAEGDLQGGNAGGRTCVSADGNPFEVSLSSWNWDDACPNGYVPLQLSVWIKVAGMDRYIQVNIYPRQSQVKPYPGAQVPEVASAPTYENGKAAFDREDYATALSIFQPLAEQENAEAQSDLGNMYAFGWGVTQNYQVAERWYLLAAGQGHLDSQLSLASMYEHGQQGVPQNDAEAMRWLRLAAAQGDGMGSALAQLALDRMIAEGRGSP